MPLVCFWHGMGSPMANCWYIDVPTLILCWEASCIALQGLHPAWCIGVELGVHVQSLSEEIFHSEDVERVVQMQLKLGYGDWAAFFQLATNATYLQGCLAHMYFQGVRARALNAIAAAGKRAWDTLILLTVTQNVHEILTGHLEGAALHRTQC